MTYCMTIEQVRRFAIEIEADNNDEAVKKAESIFGDVDDSDFCGGDEEYDYALVDEGGVDVVAWS